jgi:hypothetical protein
MLMSVAVRTRRRGTRRCHMASGDWLNPAPRRHVRAGGPARPRGRPPLATRRTRRRVGGRAVSPARRHGTRLLAAQRARGNARAGAWVCPRPGPVAVRGWLALSRFAWAAGFGWFFLFPSDFLPSRPVQPRFAYLGHDVEITFNRTKPNLQSTRRTQPATLLPLQHTMRGPHHHSPHPSLQPPASLSSPSPPPSDPQESGGGGGGLVARL